MKMASLSKTDEVTPQQSNACASSASWGRFLLTVLLAAACSFVLRLLKPSSFSPYLTTLLMCLWWLTTSYFYVRLLHGNTLTTSAFINWVLMTPRMRLYSFTAMAVGCLLCVVLAHALPLLITFGLKTGRHSS